MFASKESLRYIDEASLRELAERRGLSLPKDSSKAEIVEAILSEKDKFEDVLRGVVYAELLQAREQVS